MKRYILADIGTVFSTRSVSARISELIKQQLYSLPRNDVLVLDFSNVEAISYSFTDELLKNLVEALDEERNDDKNIAFTGTTDNILNVMSTVLERRHCSLNEPQVDCGRDIRLLNCISTV